MRRNVQLRCTIGLALIIVFAALSTARTIQLALGTARSDIDDVTAYGERIEPAKAFLPRDGQIGYVSDDNDYVFLKDYYLTQYFLVPLLVRNIDNKSSDNVYLSPLIAATSGNNYPIVIGKFNDTNRMNAILAAKHLVVVTRVGQGIVILKKGQ